MLSLSVSLVLLPLSSFLVRTCPLHVRESRAAVATLKHRRGKAVVISKSARVCTSEFTRNISPEQLIETLVALLSLAIIIESSNFQEKSIRAKRKIDL